MDDIRPMLAGIAILMTVWAHIPYLRETLSGRNKPHIFTWMIWGLLTFIAFAAQLAGGAGIGAWVTGVTGAICLIIIVASLKRGEFDISRADWVMFGLSLLAIPLWLVTSNPLWAVVLVTGIDCLAFGPTFRKSWNKPFEENTFMYGFNVPRHALAISALEVVTLTTAIYPLVLLVMNLIMYATLKWRRHTLREQN